MSGNIKDMVREECPKCNKHVFDAEGFPAGGKRFHKKCFKCSRAKEKMYLLSQLDSLKIQLL